MKEILQKNWYSNYNSSSKVEELFKFMYTQLLLHNSFPVALNLHLYRSKVSQRKEWLEYKVKTSYPKVTSLILSISFQFFIEKAKNLGQELGRIDFKGIL